MKLVMNLTTLKELPYYSELLRNEIAPSNLRHTVHECVHLVMRGQCCQVTKYIYSVTLLK